jgi:hypothetical protein
MQAMINRFIEFSDQIPLTFGVTGHRDICDEDWPRVEVKIRRLIAAYRAYYPSTPFVIISSLASGADCLVAQCVLAADPLAFLYVVLPFGETEYLKDFSPAEAKIYQTLVDSDRVIKRITLQAHQQTLTQKEKDSAYLQVGEFVALHAHVMFAIKSAQDNEKIGGTAQVFKFRLDGCSKKDGQDASNIRYAESGLLYDLRVRRRSEPDTQPPTDADDRIYITPQSESHARIEKKINSRLTRSTRKWSERRRSELLRMLQKLSINTGESNADQIARHIEDLNRNISPNFVGDAIWVESPFDTRHTDALQKKTDFLAMQQQVKYKRLFNLLLLTAVFATFLQIASGLPVIKDLPAMDEMGSYLKVPLVIAAFGLWKLIKKIKTSQEGYRALSEALKIQGYWLRLGVQQKSPADFFLATQLGENSWLRRTLRIVRLLDLQDRASEEVIAPKEYKALITKTYEHWIAGPSAQINYFKNKLVKLRMAERLTRYLGYGFLGAGGVLLALSYAPATLYLKISAELSHMFGVMGTAAIACYVVLTAYRGFHSYETFIQRYEVALYVFSQAAKRYAVEAESLSAENNLMVANSRLKELFELLGESVLEETSDWFIANSRIEFRAR